jgi:ribosomal protein S20
VFGRTVGFGGQSAKEYLEKLASFKNTPEGRAALEKEQKSSADRSAKSRDLGQKIDAAIKAKDFKAAESALKEIFADVSGSRKAVFHYNKARILLQIDPAAKAQALKYVDEALAVAAGDESLTKSFKAYRDKIASEAPAAPQSADVPKKGA